MSTYDTFPRRNLPPESEAWGREIEGMIYALQNRRDATELDVSGQNRSAASSLADLARQLDKLYELYEQIPKVVQKLGSTANFGLPSAGWNNIAAAAVTVPEGAKTATITAIANARLLSPTKNASVEASGRLVLNGSSAGPEIPGTWAPGMGEWSNFINPSYSWQVAVTPGTTLTTTLQAKPSAVASWPSGTGSYGVVSMFIVFTAV